MIKIEVNNTIYEIIIESKKRLYTKIKIFENSNDVTSSIYGNEELLDLLIKEINRSSKSNKIIIPCDHHFVPKHILKNWKDANGRFNTITLDKIENIKTIEIKDDNNKKIKNLENKFSSLHNYTFLINDFIVIFEGSFINFTEEFIYTIVNYLTSSHKSIENEDKNIKFTEELLKKCKFTADRLVSDKKNSQILYLYSLITFAYTSMEKNKLNLSNIFTNIFNIFENTLNNLNIEEALQLYFLRLFEQSQKVLLNELGENFVFSAINAPNNFDFMISENWIFYTGDTNQSLQNIVVPLTPKNALLFSRNYLAQNSFHQKMKKNNDYITAFLDLELHNLDNLKEKEYIKDEKRYKTSKTYILTTEKNIDIVNTYLQKKLDKDSYLDELYLRKYPTYNGISRIDFFTSSDVDLNSLF